DCPMCLRGQMPQQGDMERGIFARLQPLFPGAESILLTGNGEPLLNPHILEMVRQAKGALPPGGRVGLITNSSLLEPAMARELANSGLDELGVSLDGATPATYQAVRPEGDFELALAGIQAVAEARRELGQKTPRLSIHFVAMRQNLAELPQLVALAREVEAQAVVVSHLFPYTEALSRQIVYGYHSDASLDCYRRLARAAARAGVDLSPVLEFMPYVYTLAGLPPLRNISSPDLSWLHGLPSGKRLALELAAESLARAAQEKVALNLAKLLAGEGLPWDEAAEIFSRARRQAKAEGTIINLPPLSPRASRECGFMRDEATFITWDGFVCPCQNLSHSYRCYVNGRLKSITQVSFGNVREQEPRDIWDSPSYRAFRALSQRFDFPPCGDCGYSDGCSLIRVSEFQNDCYFHRQPCGDCPWSRGLFQC
ncbi:MAG: radical SAM protein, partial [Dehalococcoidia bacterium]